MVVKIKESFEKTKHVKKIFYEDKEIQDIMKKYYQIKSNLIQVSSLEIMPVLEK